MLLDSELFAEGHERLVGVDEVGRGCLAGPLTVAAVCLDPHFPDLGQETYDSKALSQTERELLVPLIKQYVNAYAIVSIKADQIDEVNITKATRWAAQRAVLIMWNRLKREQRLVKVILTDGKYKMGLGKMERPIIKGDSLSLAIGAASILAKVHRDKQMSRFHKIYPQYDWAQNKGYPTQKHKAALEKHGLSRIHRRTFCKWLCVEEKGEGDNGTSTHSHHVDG